MKQTAAVDVKVKQKENNDKNSIHLGSIDDDVLK